MKMLTLHQPWASLIAVGAKTIETRSWSTDYRGPLAIHAAKALTWPTGYNVGAWRCYRHSMGSPRMYDRSIGWATSPEVPISLPLGAVVAVCDLVDVVPINENPARPFAPNVYDMAGTLTLRRSAEQVWPEDISDQLPFGDFTPGRYAWLLDNVRPVDPIPCKGFQGLRDCPAEVPA